jgi:PAS domain S-box-containing protein
MSKQTRHILVIDDNAEDRAVFRWYLEQDADFAYTIQEAELGAQGIAAYASVRPDCVLLDYRLPDMDGLEVLSVLTEGKIPPDIAVVMLTGTGNEAIAVQALRRGAHDYLVKGKAVAEDIRRAVSNAIEKVELVRRLNEQRKWLQGTLASIGDAVIATDVAGCVTFMNEVAQRLTGWTQTDAEGQQIGDIFRIVHEETNATVESSVERTLREGVIVGPANRTLLAKDGREVPIDDSVAPIHDQTGALLGAVRVFRDISARKQAEEQLRRNHETFYNLIQNTPFGIYIVDADFRLVEISKGSKKVFNNVASPIGRDFAEVLRTLWKEPFATEVIERFRHTFLEGEPYRSSNTTEQRGDIEDVESYDWKIERITLPDGRYGVVCYFYDLTERLQFEKKLRESEQQLRTALNTIKREQRQLQTILASLPVGVMVTDQGGAALMLNQALNDIWRGSRTVESLNHCEHYEAWELGTNKRFDLEDWPIYRTLKTGEPQAEREFAVRRFDGTTGIMSAVAVPLKDEEGALIGGVSVAQDITERKRADAERTRLLDSEQRLRAAAEEANRLKDEFLATASHELRTPLTAIIGWARMLRSGKLDSETASQALATIERNANVQTKLIEDLLDISRILSGKLLLDIRPLQMASVISDAVNTVSPAAHAKNIAIEVSIDSLVDSVPGDANRLQQVIWNLLSNAVKFTPKDGCVMVALRRVDAQIEISVRDTGLGIEPEFLPYVFDRFRQADGKTTKKHGGLGLGLAIVRHLVELHGGEVKAHSDGLGSGSSFIVSLPLVGEHALTASRATPPIQVETIVDTCLPINCPPKLDGLRVLVVDDDWDTLEMLSAILCERDAEVVTVASAAEAILEIERRRPDVLVSDIGMPDEDGYDLIKWVREMEEERGEHAIPALALTAYAKASDRVRALAAGYQVHLAKPVEPAELALVVANLAGRINVSG